MTKKWSGISQISREWVNESYQHMSTSHLPATACILLMLSQTHAPVFQDQ